MDLTTLRKKAREELKGFCRVCPVCDGRVCAGEAPGMGGMGTGSSFAANLSALSAYRLNMRTLHEVKSADTSITLFGRKLSMPVLAAPMTGVLYNMGGKLSEEAFIRMIVAGADGAGTLGSCGDGADPAFFASGLTAIREQEGRGIPFIKPRGQDAIKDMLAKAEEAGAAAVGVDVDGAGLLVMALKGQPVSPKTQAELRELIGATRLPFLVKGIMTPDEAQIAFDAGAAGIVVSNHGGRVLDHTPGAAEVLPAIARAVKGRGVILADGGVRSGADVLKYLALGADAVLLGRPLVIGAFGGGDEGVTFLLNKLKAELTAAMLLTGTASVRAVSPQIVSPQPCRG